MESKIQQSKPEAERSCRWKWPARPARPSRRKASNPQWIFLPMQRDGLRSVRCSRAGPAELKTENRKSAGMGMWECGIKAQPKNLSYTKSTSRIKKGLSQNANSFPGCKACKASKKFHLFRSSTWLAMLVTPLANGKPIFFTVHRGEGFCKSHCDILAPCL